MGDEQLMRRLGKKELGPHAYEQQMPARVSRLLEAEDGKNNVLSHVLPKLAELLHHDRELEVAYLCTDRVQQVSKLQHEGAHFCGYRNMQMLLSALDSSAGEDSWSEQRVPKSRFPVLLRLQDMIEQAWDSGYNPHGRVLTGGIRGTRKHVGTSEAEALFLSLDVPCTGHAFHGKEAWRELLDFVETYFQPAERDAVKARVVRTGLCPIFLQRPNHSWTIVGLERTKTGKRRLLAFDPAWQPPAKMQSSCDYRTLSGWSARVVLQRYRKSQRSLKRFGDFETLSIDKPD
ncbi:Hypothetical predicted protein [Lecanosticta acicola]|uniref:UFSP1/2/DUB catalytic domain-containing protein n=1 Tax=Lecanosticta acicola TaxID=111012 RepID=A0AAI8Z000_9PEZI|nr:Hypothetical predicted protein [Lecanosticta acicola]